MPRRWLLIEPFVGFLLYLIFADKQVPRRLSGYSKEVKQDSLYYIKNYSVNLNKIRDLDLKKQFEYAENYSNYPCFTNTSSKYFSSGALFFEDFIKKLEGAKNFLNILHYFIATKRYPN